MSPGVGGTRQQKPKITSSSTSSAKPAKGPDGPAQASGSQKKTATPRPAPKSSSTPTPALSSGFTQASSTSASSAQGPPRGASQKASPSGTRPALQKTKASRNLKADPAVQQALAQTSGSTTAPQQSSGASPTTGTPSRPPLQRTKASRNLKADPAVQQALARTSGSTTAPQQSSGASPTTAPQQTSGSSPTTAPQSTGSVQAPSTQKSQLGQIRSQLGTKGTAMGRLEQEMASLDAILDNPNSGLNSKQKSEGLARRREIMNEYNGLRDERRTLGTEIGKLGKNPVVELARPDQLAKGTNLFSVQSPEKLKRILQEGVGFLEKGGGTSTYDAPELGPGFYVDTTGGAYRMDNKPLLVLQTTDQLPGVSTRPFEEMRRANQFDSSTIDQGYQKLLKKDPPYIRHEGLPPENTELVLRQQGMGKVKILGVIPNPPQDGAPPMDQMVSIQDYARRNNLTLDKGWGT